MSPLRRTCRSLILAAVFGGIAVSSCGPARPPRLQTDIGSPNRRPQQTVAVDRPLPPWQLWDAAEGDSPLAAADALESSGRFEEAARAYREIELREPAGRTREEAFSRRISVLLKSGQSRTALEEITRHLKEEGRSSKDVSPVLALLAAYAYLHLNDTDQTLAWLGVTIKKTDSRGLVARRAITEAERVVRSIAVEKFDPAYQLWLADPAMAAIFQREKARRAQGGPPQATNLAEWYNAATYGGSAAGNLRETDLASGAAAPLGEAANMIGVLLPETGKYAEHAGRVRQGIELALLDSGQAGSVRLEFADTAGDPQRAELEYDRLAQEGAAVVLGPLLVKDTEQVARRSAALKVPLLTFTKRPGITQLSPVAFRLGATAENQASELVTYAVQQLHLKRFAVMFPLDGGNGEEFAAAFRAAVAKAGGELRAEASYVPRNTESQGAAVAAIAASRAQAIFIPDTIEGAAAMVQSVRASPLKQAVLLGPALWDDAVAIRGFSSVLEGAVVVTPFYVSSSRPPVTQFVQRYRQSYGRDPELLAAQGYDAARIVISSLLNTQAEGGDLREKLIPVLRAADNIEGVTGRLDVEDNGEVRRRMSVLRLHNGDVIEVMSGGNVTGFIPDEPKSEQQEVANQNPA